MITIERELLAEVVGETKVCVTGPSHNFEEEWSFVMNHHPMTMTTITVQGQWTDRQEAQSQGPGHDHPKRERSIIILRAGNHYRLFLLSHRV